jgi:hypothetical protein
MGCRHLIIAAMLAAFVPSALPVVVADTAEAAQVVKKKKKKVIRREEPRVKKNFRAPRPGEPDAGWTDDCLFYYNVYGRTPAYCGKYGRGFRTWDW